MTKTKLLIEALKFYADPENYFAIAFFPDPPCGEFINDFSETENGLRPGKKAREVLNAIYDQDRKIKADADRNKGKVRLLRSGENRRSRTKRPADVR
jgi:hypothetical protein